MIHQNELSEVRVLCKSVAFNIQESEYLNRTDIEVMRVWLTRALARVNAVERVVVGVPVPKSGDEL